MADFDMLRSYTPQEINQLQQILAQRYQEGALQNQNMNTAANMTKNLSPAANLGIALGTLGGKWAAQRFNDVFDKDVYNNRKREEKINDFINWSKNGVKYKGEGLPTEGVLASELPAYFPNSKFFINGQEWNPKLGLTWQDWQKTQGIENNTAPATASLINYKPSYNNFNSIPDWRNINLMPQNNPFNNSASMSDRIANYSNGTRKNFLTAYNPID